MAADAMATGLMILPPDEAWRLVRRAEFEARLVVREEGGFRVLTTPEFPILDAAAAR
jgi:thiamine biosynthesis lipoprotein ApbE